LIQSRWYPGAAELKVLKRRQKTVTQIGKICGVLKVVAQSRLAVAQEKAQQVTPFYETMHKLFAPLTDKIRDKPDTDTVTIIVYTDRGLCGPCNNGINRQLDKENLDGQNVIVWGEKGCSGFEKSKHKSKVLMSAHPSLKKTLNFLEISNFVLKVQKEDCSLYRIIFNKMTGPNSSEIQEIWLPHLKELENDEDVKEILSPYEIEASSGDEMLHNLSEFHLSSAINYAVFNNLAVELFQRRNSMENANKNSKEVVKKIKLKYNKARQQMITTELGEIVSGAAAVDEMIKKR